MPNATDLPHLFRLLEDDSEVVRETVLTALSAFGPYLEIELSRSKIATTAEDRHRLRNLLGQHARQWLQRAWPQWRAEETDHARLEGAMALVAEFQYGPGYPARLTPLLDQLADAFAQRVSHPDPLALASYLFKTKGLKGAEKDYHNPFHSNLVYVIEEGRGIPLSLVSVYILVAGRLGLKVRGVNFPGHFLARAEHDGRIYVVDAFNSGRFLRDRDLMMVQRGASTAMQSILEAPCTAETIIARCLRNLQHAYRQEDQPENAALMAELHRSILPEPPDEA
jgi:regulator of sirC expression with transglutaminase-like and TPR domain